MLYAWGVNKHGQLGVGDFTNKAAPTLDEFEQITTTKIADEMVYAMWSCRPRRG